MVCLRESVVRQDAGVESKGTSCIKSKPVILSHLLMPVEML